MTVWTLPLARQHAPTKTENFTPHICTTLCDDPDCSRFAVGTWQDDARLCFHHSKIAEYQWLTRKSGHNLSSLKT